MDHTCKIYILLAGLYRSEIKPIKQKGPWIFLVCEFALRTKRGAATAYLHSSPDPTVYVLLHFQLSFLTPPQGSRC